MALTCTNAVGVLRRYSKQPHLWRASKTLQKITRTRPELTPTRDDVAIRPFRRLDIGLSEEVLARLAADYERGLTIAELQKKYRLAKSSVSAVLKQAGTEMRRRSLSEPDAHQCVELYAAGLSIRRVAEAMGLPKSTVQDALRAAQVPMRPAVRYKSPGD